MEQITEFIFSLSPFWIYLSILLIAWIENIFPPMPSDLIIVFCGSLIPLNLINFIPSVISATIGGAIGFLTMYFIGNKFGLAIVNNQYYKFISAETLDKIEKWFVKHGLSIIILNRFLSGTRAFISFAAGFLHLHLPSTIIFSTLSSLFWNTILIYLGFTLGKQWKQVGIYLSAYGQFITGLILISLVAWWAWKLFFSKKND